MSSRRSLANDLWSTLMKLHEIKLPSITHYHLRYVLPAAVLTTCLLVVAVVELPGRIGMALLPRAPTVTSGAGDRSCDIFKGEWVPDDAGGAPYTGESCPVIHGHYDCMRYGRPDLGYVRWRWRPAGCELPRLDAARFLAALRGKSMAFVGDSLARNQMHSLVCLLAAEERPAPWSNGSDVYRFERGGFAVAAFWSPFLVRAAETDPDGPTRSGSGLWSLAVDEADPRWAARAGEFDYVVVSAGSWFYRPSLFYDRRGRLVGCNGCLAPGVADLSLRYSLRMAFRSALRAAATAAGARGGARTTVVVRTLSPSHYENGTWNEDGDCARARPFLRGEWEMDALQKEMYRIQREEFAAAAAEAAARGRGRGVRMLLLDSTEAMALRPDGHPGKYRLWQPEKFKVSRDCVHWCLPGAMDACSDMLSHMLIG